MGRVATAAMAGSIIRRVREDKGMSRAKLSEATGVSTRSLYALEAGESENFGLANYLKVLDALGLSLSIDFPSNALSARSDAAEEAPPWDDLGELWRLDDASRR